MAWTYWTAELSSGDVLALEMVREWCAALQERYRALLGNTTAIVRMRGGTNGDHRAPLNQMIEVSADGTSFTAYTPHGAVDIMDGGWVKESDLDSTGTATAEDFASALTGLGFTKAQLEASWVQGGVMSAKYWTYLRRVVQLMKVLPVTTLTVSGGLGYYVLNGDPEVSSFPPFLSAGAASDANDWITARTEGAITLPTLPHISTAERIWFYIDIYTQAAGAFAPGFQFDLTLGSEVGTFSAPSTVSGSLTSETKWRGMAYPGGYTNALDFRPTNYGAYSTAAYNDTQATMIFDVGAGNIDAYIKPAWDYP